MIQEKLSNVEMLQTQHRTFFESGLVLIKVQVQWIQFFIAHLIHFR